MARAAGSLGDADLVALQDGKRPMLIEVKSTADGPYKTFGPKERAELSFAARLAGAEAWLVWWPPRGKARWIAEHEWPNNVPIRLTKADKITVDPPGWEI